MEFKAWNETSKQERMAMTPEEKRESQMQDWRQLPTGQQGHRIRPAGDDRSRRSDSGVLLLRRLRPRVLRMTRPTVLAILTLLLVVGCEGPMGPEGPQGPPGPQGIQGEKGDPAAATRVHVYDGYLRWPQGSTLPRDRGSASHWVRSDEYDITIDNSLVACWAQDPRNGVWILTDPCGITSEISRRFNIPARIQVTMIGPRDWRYKIIVLVSTE